MTCFNRSVGLRDWRWVAAFGVILYLSGAFIFSARYGHLATQHLLQAVGVPALEYPFMDMRGVAGWCDASKLGKDPATEQTWIMLPDGRPHLNFVMNYSPLVLAFGNAGLSGMHVVAFSLLLISLFLVSLWFLCPKCTPKEALLWLLLVCSPCSVLVMERANLDMLLFVLLVAALLVRKHPLLEAGLILSAALLKFFPIGALVSLWREGGRRNRLAVLLAGVVFAAFLYYLKSRLSAIGGSLTGQYQSSFGCGVVADLFHHNGTLSDSAYAMARYVMSWAGVVWVMLGCLAGLCSKGSSVQKIPNGDLHAFFLTAPIMLGLFLLGNQMDYKWIFFLPMVPAVLLLQKSGCRFDEVVSKFWIGGVLAYSYWTFFSDEGSLRNSLLKQLLMWGIMILTAFLCGRLWKRPEHDAILPAKPMGSV